MWCVCVFVCVSAYSCAQSALKATYALKPSSKISVSPWSNSLNTAFLLGQLHISVNQLAQSICYRIAIFVLLRVSCIGCLFVHGLLTNRPTHTPWNDRRVKKPQVLPYLLGGCSGSLVLWKETEREGERVRRPKSARERLRRIIFYFRCIRTEFA